MPYNLKTYAPVIRETLASGGTFRLYPRGRSMLPFLREGRDSVTLAAPGTIRRKDVVLCEFEGHFWLHRVLRSGQTLTLCGDNARIPEKKVPPGSVLGVVRRVWRGERELSLRSPGIQLYLFFWCDLFPLRFAALFCRDAAGKLCTRAAALLKRPPKDRSDPL